MARYRRARGQAAEFPSRALLLERLEARQLLSITTDSFSGGVLTVNFNGADSVTISQSGGSVRVNGSVPSGGGAASAVTAINVAGSGNFDNVIDLSGVGSTQGFTALSSVTVNSGGAVTGDTLKLGPLNASGAVSISGLATATATMSSALVVGSLAITASTIDLNSVSSSGAQTYNGPISLPNDVTLTAGSGNVAFNSTIDGSHSLTVNSSGMTTFGGSIGAATRLANLTTDAAGTTALSAPAIFGNDITFNDPVVLGGDVRAIARRHSMV